MLALGLLGGVAAAALLPLFLRRASWPLWVYFVALAVVFPVVGLAQGRTLDAFFLAKTVGVAGGGLVLAAWRTWPSRCTPWAPGALYGLFVANIAMAVVSEGLAGGMANAFTGVILCLTLPMAGAVRLVAAGPRRWVEYDLGWAWIVVYTLWNAAFVIRTGAPGEAAGSFAWLIPVHLLAPLFFARGDAAHWAEARLVALAWCVGWLDVFRGSELAPAVSWTTPGLASFVGIVSVGASAFLLGFHGAQHAARPPSALAWLAQRLRPAARPGEAALKDAS